MTTRTYEEEIKRRLDKLKEELEWGGLDPELYDILVGLNSKGYFTFQSCAGHQRGALAYGSINFAINGVPSKEGLLWLLRTYGLKDIKLEFHYPYDDETEQITATFAPIGSQYSAGDRLLLKDPYDWDAGHLCPPLPDKCPTCGGSGFWLKGDPYVRRPKLIWRCMKCQPRPFRIDNGEEEEERKKEERLIKRLVKSSGKSEAEVRQHYYDNKAWHDQLMAEAAK